ncbi:MAG TPA: murein biosynthesis integral membrane protein MurJ [Acidobacteriota bacterium]|nr:murein biosynthesis integral membrane protein MurJ [Acidobacteriota bacterium]
MTESPPKIRSLARTAGAVSVATLISRILGLIREMVLAKYFTVFATDAFFAAFRIPNLLRDLFAEGALSAAFVPTFTEYKQNRSRQEAWQLANIVLNALVVILSIVTLLILIFAKYLVLFLVSGYAKIPGKLDLTIHLTRIMSPFLMTVALAAAVMGILNTHGRFFTPAVAPAFFNVFSILAGIFLSPLMPHIGQEPITAMAIGSLLGGVAQLAVQLPAVYRCGFHYEFRLDWNHPGLRRISRLMLPAAFGLAATQINILIDNQLASYLGNGPVSWLNYAFRLMQLPIGLFGVAIATVHLTSASHQVAANNIQGLKTNLADAIKLAAFLNIPATAGLMFLRYPIVQLLYERGRFTHEYTIYTGDALLCYSIGLFAYSLVKIVTPTFYALGDTKKPVQFSAFVILLKIAINLALIQKLGFIGLALGTSIASLLNTGLLLNALRKRIGGLGGHEILSTLLRIVLASLLMGAAALYIHDWLAMRIGMDSLQQKSAVLAVTMIAALALLMLLSYLFKVNEAKTILGIITRKRRQITD